MAVYVDWRLKQRYKGFYCQSGEINAMLGLPSPGDTRFVDNRPVYIAALVLDITIGIAAYLYGETGIAWFCGVGAVVGLIYIVVGSVFH